MLSPETEEDRPEEIEIFKEVARRIRAARVRQGLTQDNLAERLGMKKAYVFQLERGTANPTLKTLVRVGSALGLEPADLMPRMTNVSRSNPDAGDLLSTCSAIIASITKKREENESASAHELELLSHLHSALDRLASSGTPEPERNQGAAT